MVVPTVLAMTARLSLPLLRPLRRAWERVVPRGGSTSCPSSRAFDYAGCMEFRVGRIVAKCPHCGGTQFKIPADARFGPRMSYLCADCTKATAYAKLVEQIGREAQRQRAERLSSTGSLHLHEPRAAPNSLLVKPVHGVADHGADEEGRGGPHVEPVDGQRDEQRAHERPDDRTQPPDAELPSGAERAK